MTGRERRTYDVGRLAVLVTAPPLKIFFKESRAELRRFVAVRHATLFDNDLANTYRAYAWWTLAGVVFVVGILVTFIFGRSTPQADAWSLAGLGFLVFTGLLSLLRAGRVGRMAHAAGDGPDRVSRQARAERSDDKPRRPRSSERPAGIRSRRDLIRLFVHRPAP